MNEKKYNTVVIIWGVALIILQLFTVFSNIGRDTIYENAKTISIVIGIVMLILLVLYLVLSLKKIKAGPIIGIITGAIYITNLSLINIAIGICFIISCVDMLKELKKEY